MEEKKYTGHPVLAVVLLMVLLVFLGAVGYRKFEHWSHPGKTDGAVVELTGTAAHSREELDWAAEAALEEFKELEDCTLIRMWYDEEQAAPIETSRGIYRGQTQGDYRANYIVLMLEFQTGNRPLKHPYRMNSYYADGYFVLHREGESWTVVNHGVGTEPEADAPETVTPPPTPTPKPDGRFPVSEWE